MTIFYKIRIIGHLDMDAFFAAIEEQNSPQFRELPLVVGANPKNGLGRGVVSTANYKAREFGIHSAMPITQAWRLAEAAKKKGQPETVFVPPNMRLYADTSARIIEIVQRYVSAVEQSSIDEAYLDLNFIGSYKKAVQLCKKIKKDIKDKEKLTASIGIGPNKLVAKIASDSQKPDGLTVIEEKDAEKFLEPLAIRKIPGIGPKTETLFKNKGVKTVKELKRFSEADLYEFLGQWGLELYDKIRGYDDTPLETRYQAKSIGEQETFEKDSDDSGFIAERIAALCRSVIKTFNESDFKTFKRVALTMRFANFTTKTKSHMLAKPESTLRVFRFQIMKMLLPFFDHRENPNHRKFRLVGVRLEELK